MTLFLVDVSRYQVDRADPLDLVQAQAVGFHLVNIALNKGLKVADARRYADWARELGMGVCGYWWLDGVMSGAVQAAAALHAMAEIGGPDGIAHQVDCEDTDNPATERTWRDYVTAVQDGLGRHVAAYTGDWWWTNPARGWHGADLTPYLWAGPNAGRINPYPGDDSPHWAAGYGGWPELAVMQYAVARLPGTGPCSLSAIRDPAVWTALTGGPLMVDWYLNRALTNFRAAVNAAYPGRDKTSDGTIGDPAHQATTSDHNPDPDGSVDAWDMDVEVNGPGKPYTADVEALKAVFQAHESARYWIHNEQVASRSDGWMRRPYDGINKHTLHVHWNTRSEFENSTKPWPLERDDDMFCKYGDTGPVVKYLQFRLYHAGFSALVGAADSDYGDKTAAAVKANELKYGLASDGRTYGPDQMLRLDLTWGTKFPGPKGDRGPAGPTGPAGPAGPQGEPGGAVLPARVTLTGDLTAAD